MDHRDFDSKSMRSMVILGSPTAIAGFRRYFDNPAAIFQSSGGPSCSPAILTMRGSKRATLSTRSA